MEYADWHATCLAEAQSPLPIALQRWMHMVAACSAAAAHPPCSYHSTSSCNEGYPPIDMTPSPRSRAHSQ